jgi:hypothetical protein
MSSIFFDSGQWDCREWGLGWTSSILVHFSLLKQNTWGRLTSWRKDINSDLEVESSNSLVLALTRVLLLMVGLHVGEWEITLPIRKPNTEIRFQWSLLKVVPHWPEMPTKTHLLKVPPHLISPHQGPSFHHTSLWQGQIYSISNHSTNREFPLGYHLQPFSQDCNYFHGSLLG